MNKPNISEAVDFALFCKLLDDDGDLNQQTFYEQLRRFGGKPFTTTDGVTGSKKLAGLIFNDGSKATWNEDTQKFVFENQTELDVPKSD